jgi:hypothetical protein
VEPAAATAAFAPATAAATTALPQPQKNNPSMRRRVAEIQNTDQQAINNKQAAPSSHLSDVSPSELAPFLMRMVAVASLGLSLSRLWMKEV